MRRSSGPRGRQDGLALPQWVWESMCSQPSWVHEGYRSSASEPIDAPPAERTPLRPKAYPQGPSRRDEKRCSVAHARRQKPWSKVPCRSAPPTSSRCLNKGALFPRLLEGTLDLGIGSNWSNPNAMCVKPYAPRDKQNGSSAVNNGRAEDPPQPYLLGAGGSCRSGGLDIASGGDVNRIVERRFASRGPSFDNPLDKRVNRRNADLAETTPVAPRSPSN